MDIRDVNKEEWNNGQIDYVDTKRKCSYCYKSSISLKMYHNTSQHEEKIAVLYCNNCEFDHVFSLSQYREYRCCDYRRKDLLKLSKSGSEFDQYRNNCSSTPSYMCYFCSHSVFFFKLTEDSCRNCFGYKINRIFSETLCPKCKYR